MQTEKRSATGIKAEGRKLVGYAAVFNQTTRIADFQERIAPGAFSASLSSGRDIIALADHDMTRVLGRLSSGSLKLAEDAHGLRFELEVPDTQAGRDLLSLAERGDLGGMSFGFVVPDGGDEWNDGVRTLKNISIYEISVVSAFPAYAGTSVEARNMDGVAERLRLARIRELEGGAHVAI